MALPVSHVWKPSSARLVVVDSFVPVPRGSVASAPPALNWAAKDPQDILDYQVDISPAVLGNVGDAIASVNASVMPNQAGDLMINSVAADGASVILWLAGGQIGTVYTVTLQITTTNGRVLQRSILLPVLALSTPPIPVNALQTGSGVILTDQNGNPVLVI